MLDKIVFRQSQVILLFSSACFFDIISSMYPQILADFGKILLALILGSNSKSRVFEKYTLSPASFQLEHPLVEDFGFGRHNMRSLASS